MATNTQAFDFLKTAYRDIWQSYSADDLGRHYNKKLRAHSAGRAVYFEELHNLLKQHSGDLGYMQPKFHHVAAHGQHQLVAWFTTMHYYPNGHEAYHLHTMANYTIKDDKVVNLEFMWDKPIDFVLQRQYSAASLLRIANPAIGKALSQRELQCFFYLIQDRSAKEIANIIHISKRTVEAHINKIKSKLNLLNSRDIIDFAIANGYLTIAPIFNSILPSLNGDSHESN